MSYCGICCDEIEPGWKAEIDGIQACKRCKEIEGVAEDLIGTERKTMDKKDLTEKGQYVAVLAGIIVLGMVLNVDLVLVGIIAGWDLGKTYIKAFRPKLDKK